MSGRIVCICCWGTLPASAFSQAQPCDICAAVDPSTLNKDQKERHKHAAQVRLNRLINSVPVSMYPK